MIPLKRVMKLCCLNCSFYLFSPVGENSLTSDSDDIVDFGCVHGLSFENAGFSSEDWEDFFRCLFVELAF